MQQSVVDSTIDIDKLHEKDTRTFGKDNFLLAFSGCCSEEAWRLLRVTHGESGFIANDILTVGFYTELVRRPFIW